MFFTTFFKMKKVFFCILAAAMLTGCKGQVAFVMDELVVYSVETTDNSLSWDKFVEKIEIIPLETNLGSIIGELFKGIVVDDDVYIFDFQNQLLLNFDISGKFKRTISGKGRGPEEYFEARDFSVVGDNIYILDYQRIHSFCRITGKKKETWSFDTGDNFNPANMCIFDKNNYFLWDSNPFTRNPKDGVFYKLHRMQENEVLERFFKYEYPLWDEPRRFYMIDKLSCYIRPIDGEDIVYKITKDSLIASFKIDFGRMAVTVPELKEVRDISQRNAYFHSNKFKSISNVFEVMNYIYFSCIGPNGFKYHGLICKATGNVNFEVTRVSPVFFASDGIYLYGYYDQFSIETLNKNNVQHFFDSVWLGENQYDIEDNMVLVKVLLK